MCKPAAPREQNVKTEPEASRALDIAVCALLALLPLLAFFEVAVGTRGFFLRDVARFYYPVKLALRDIVTSGDFPLWNRLFAGGQPLAANPEFEVFYPPTWLILLPSFDLGFRMEVLLHISIALVAMYALLRSLDLLPAVSAVGAACWGFGGVVMSYVNLHPYLFAASWLPFTCLFTRRFLIARRSRDFAAAALFLGLQCLVGEPTTILQTGLLLGAYALYRAWNSKDRSRAASRLLLSVAAVSLGAFLVAAVQMLPMLDLVRDSVRSRGLPFPVVSEWSMPWPRLGEMVLPNLFGHISPEPNWYWGGGHYAPRRSPFLFSIYAGLLVPTLAAAAALSRLRGSRFALVVATFGFLLAAGRHTPILAWAYRAGLAGALRYPEKFAMSAVFSLVLLAALALDRIARGDEAIRRAMLLTSGLLAASLTAMVFISCTSLFPDVMRHIAPGRTISAGMLQVARRDTVVGAVRAVLLVSLIAAARTHRRRAWQAAAFVFVLADLLPLAQEINPRMPRSFFDLPPLSRELPPDRRAFRLFHQADWDLGGKVSAQYLSHGRAFWTVRNGLFPVVSAAAGVETALQIDYDETTLMPTAELTHAMFEVKAAGRKDWYAPFMAMSNSWFRTEYRPFEEELRRIRGDLTSIRPVDVIPVARFPRYYLADEIVRTVSHADFVKKVASGRHSLRAAFVSEPGLAPATGNVSVVSESANGAVLDVVSAGTGFLLISVTRHKYWNVFVDGRRVQPIAANIGYQGIVVPRGGHRVEMRYVNPLVLAGGVVSILAVTALAFVAARRRPARQE